MITVSKSLKFNNLESKKYSKIITGKENSIFFVKNGFENATDFNTNNSDYLQLRESDGAVFYDGEQIYYTCKEGCNLCTSCNSCANCTGGCNDKCLNCDSCDSCNSCDTCVDCESCRDCYNCNGCDSCDGCFACHTIGNGCGDCYNACASACNLDCQTCAHTCFSNCQEYR